jgi:hypothetical protein
VSVCAVKLFRRNHDRNRETKKRLSLSAAVRTDFAQQSVARARLSVRTFSDRWATLELGRGERNGPDLVPRTSAAFSSACWYPLTAVAIAVLTDEANSAAVARKFVEERVQHWVDHTGERGAGSIADEWGMKKSVVRLQRLVAG